MSVRLFKSTAVVGGFTFFSRILGFVRDVVFAGIFGAGPLTDAFFVAFKIPNFLRRLFAEGAFSQAFVPVLSEYKANRPAEVRALVADATGALGSVLLAITLAAVVGAPLLVGLFAPGFIDDPERFGPAGEMLRITFPYIFFISLTALAAGVLNSYGRFAVPAFTPIWLNVCLITAALWAARQPETPIVALAWGVFAAGVVQLLFQLPFLGRLGLLAPPRWGWRHEGVRRILRLMGPAVFGSSVAQINLLLDTLIASFLVAGSVSWLYYADRLVEFPLGVFGIALATVILPSLSRKHAESDPAAFSRTLDWALRWVFLLGAPACLGLALLAGPLIASLFNYGAFGGEDVLMARLSLIAYAVGLPAFILVKVLAPGYYARQDTRTPVKVGVIAMGSNMVLNIAFVVPLALAGIPGPHAGLALATSLAAFINAGLLYQGLRRDGVYTPEAGWGGFLGRVVLATGVMAAVLVVLTGSTPDWIAMGLWERVRQLSVAVIAGAAIYFAALALLGIRLRDYINPSNTARP